MYVYSVVSSKCNMQCNKHSFKQKLLLPFPKEKMRMAKTKTYQD